MIAVFSSLRSPAIFYPLFAGLVAVLVLVRWLARRGAGTQRWDRAVRTAERYTLTGLIVGMLLVAMLQILLRNLSRVNLPGIGPLARDLVRLLGGLVWVDPLLRHLVLWIGVTGAAVATGRLRHMQMDVIGRLLPIGPRMLVTRITTLVAAGICAALARAAWIYLGEEAGFGGIGLLGIPTWMLTSVLFLGFALMAARFAVRAFDARERLAALLAQRETPLAEESGTDA